MWDLITWIFILEAVTITAANAATIVIFTRTRRLHSKQYIMIISQAVADLFIGLVSVPVFAVYRINQDPRLPSNSSLKEWFLVSDGFFGMASLFGLAALAIERAHATYFPFRHSTLGKGPYIIGIVLMWTAPIVPGPVVVLLVEKNTTIAKAIKTSCVMLILVVVVVAYFLIAVNVRKNTQAHDVNIQENKKLTVTLAVVTILSLVMWLPYPFLAIHGFEISPYFIYHFVKFLQYGNSIVNSIVYAFRMREIKREILRLFQCCCSTQISTSN